MLHMRSHTSGPKLPESPENPDPAPAEPAPVSTPPAIPALPGRTPEQMFELVRGLKQIGLWQRNLRTGEAHWDDTMLALWGLPPGSPPPSREHATARVVPSDREACERAWHEQPAPGQTMALVYRVVHPSGDVRVLRSTWMVERDAHGDLHTFGMALDLTSEWVAQEQRVIQAEQFDLGTNLTGLALWRLDLDRNEYLLNEQARVMYGLRPGEQLTREMLLERIHPDDHGKVNQARVDVMEAPRSIEVEYRVVLPGQSARHVLTRCHALRDGFGRATWLVGAVIDITAQRQSMEQLRALGERLQLAVNTARLGIWEVDYDENVLYVDEGICEIYGMPPGTRRLTTEQLRPYVHPEDLPRLHHEVVMLPQRDGRPGTIEFRIVRPDGSIRHVYSNFSGKHDAAGRVHRLLGTNYDITARVESERATQAVRERLELATRAAGLGIWETDLSDGSQQWDEQMFRLFGHEPHARSPREIWEAAVDATTREDLAQRLRATASGLSFDHQFLARLPSGEQRWLAVRGTPMRDASGRITRAMGVNWDVTEQALAQAAERASQAKSELLSRLSHELRTPLNAILGFSQLLALGERSGLTERSRQHLDHIHQAGTHLMHLVDEVLELSKIEAGAVTLRIAPTALLPLVQDALALVEPQVRQRSLRLQVQVDPTLHVQADPVRLRQVLINLLSNAVKYNRPAGLVVVSARPAGDTVRLAVSDTGHGLAPAQQEQLFQPFARLGQEARGVDGVGLGLVITKRLLEMMHGRIEVKSDPSAGSVFTLTLPSAGTAAHGAVEAHPRPVHLNHDTRGTVLYVEDNEINALVFENVLSFRPGVRLLMAVNQAEALAHCADVPLDVAFIDLSLGLESGYDVLQAMRVHQPACRYIALTASAMPQEKERALREGFHEFWTKPLNVDAALRGVDRLLGCPVSD